LDAGTMQMHIATRDLTVHFRNGEVINPVERGHIAFRTDDIEAYKRHLDALDVPYSDYGTCFAAEWHQLFFLDPEGMVVEVHQAISSKTM
jgi:glyoxylase I family protein